MKKRIKDLTLIEANKYCTSNTCNKKCKFAKYDICMLNYILTHPLNDKEIIKMLERKKDIE